MAKKQTPRYDKPDETLKQIGERIRAVRLEKGHANYEKFALLNDLNRVQVGRYENGGDMQLTSLFKVLNGLDISLEEFFKGL